MALPKELCDIPALKQIDARFCRIAAPPEAIRREGVDTMRCWWAAIGRALRWRERGVPGEVERRIYAYL